MPQKEGVNVMKIKWSIVLLAVLGLVAALSASLLAVSMRAKPIKAFVNSSSEEITILAAARNIPAMTVVGSDFLVETTVLKSQVSGNYYSDPTQITGKVLTVPMVEGQVFLARSFAIEGSGSHLAGMLPQGMRAVSISLSNFSGLRGLLFPGCLVDVLTSFRLPANVGLGQALSTTLLQNVEVLAVENLTVGSSPEDKEGLQNRPQSTQRRLLVTLMVDSKQAEALQLAMLHGTISLAMRNPTDVEIINRNPTLLNEGQLAQLAEFLGSSVLSGVPSVGLVAQADPPEVSQLKIKIFRGITAETLSFPSPTILGS